MRQDAFSKGLACGLQAMETGDFSVMSKKGMIKKYDLVRWMDGVIEAVMLKNGNGDMAKTVSMMMNELTNYVKVETITKQIFSNNNYFLPIDHFEAFFRFYRELVNYSNEAPSSLEITKSIYKFIKNDEKFEKVSFFDETLMPLIIRYFDQDFIKGMERNHFDDLFFGKVDHVCTAARYLVHIAKHLDRANLKKIMAYLNTIDNRQKFIRVRGVRRKLKQIFGQRNAWFNIYRDQQWPLDKKQKILFDKPCKLIGNFQNKVVFEIENKQYLFSMDESKEKFLFSPIQNLTTDNEIDEFFANGII